MVTTERFYFEPGFSFRAAGMGDEVRLLERFGSIFSVAVAARENWVEVTGDDGATARALKALNDLQTLFLLRRRELDRADVETILRQNSTVSIQSLWETRVTVAPGKREILPRSARQKEYLEAIGKHDVVFGIGPAGTGKTYLAMAMAVAMFIRSVS